MDPDAAPNELITAVVASNFDTAQERLDALRSWHERGGFPPGDPL